MIKKLTSSDLNGVAELFYNVFTKAPWFDKWESIEATKPYISELLQGDNTYGFGYYENNKLIALSLGYIFTFYKGKEYFIKEFCVDYHFQNQGIGTKFIKNIESSLIDDGIRSVWLNTEKDFLAYDFYLKQGFKVSEQTVLLYKAIK